MERAMIGSLEAIAKSTANTERPLKRRRYNLYGDRRQLLLQLPERGSCLIYGILRASHRRVTTTRVSLKHGEQDLSQFY